MAPITVTPVSITSVLRNSRAQNAITNGSGPDQQLIGSPLRGPEMIALKRYSKKAVRFLVATPLFRVCDIPGNLDDESKIVLGDEHLRSLT
jgi:hypothetical protein